jgi:hypothetical protein
MYEWRSTWFGLVTGFIGQVSKAGYGLHNPKIADAHNKFSQTAVSSPVLRRRLLKAEAPLRFGSRTVPVPQPQQISGKS